jgi:hypothetical protein
MSMLRDSSLTTEPGELAARVEKIIGDKLDTIQLQDIQKYFTDKRDVRTLSRIEYRLF